jgi:hypothetical protein
LKITLSWSGDDTFGWHGTDYVQTKGGGHPFGRPIRDIYAKNNVIYNVRGGNAVRIGSSPESDEFRDVVIENTYIVSFETGMGIHFDVQDRAAVSNVTFRNFFVEEMRYGYPTASGEFTVCYDYETRGAIRVEVLRGQYSRDVEQGGRRGMPEGLPSPRGSVRDVSIINFESLWTGMLLRPVAIGGYDAEHTVSGLTLRNGRFVFDRKLMLFSSYTAIPLGVNDFIAKRNCRITAIIPVKRQACGFSAPLRQGYFFEQRRQGAFL